MEGILTAVLVHVLIDDDTSSFESVFRHLFQFSGYEVDAQWVFCWSLGLTSDIVDLDVIANIKFMKTVWIMRITMIIKNN
jgi:uncharacterized protein (DUF362 family)